MLFEKLAGKRIGTWLCWPPNKSILVKNSSRLGPWPTDILYRGSSPSWWSYWKQTNKYDHIAPPIFSKCLYTNIQILDHGLNSLILASHFNLISYTYSNIYFLKAVTFSCALLHQQCWEQYLAYTLIIICWINEFRLDFQKTWLNSYNGTSHY